MLSDPLNRYYIEKRQDNHSYKPTKGFGWKKYITFEILEGMKLKMD
jgi:hypothetical protein